MKVTRWMVIFFLFTSCLLVFTSYNVMGNPPTEIIISNPDPANGTTGLTPDYGFSIDVNEVGGNLMNITFYSNYTGSWEVFASDDGAENGSTGTDALWIDWGDTVWWNISVNSGAIINQSGIYHYSIRNQVTPDNPYPATANLIDGNSIDIQWTKGSNATRTVVIYKAGSYPTSVTDGTVVYNNTGSNYTHNSYASNYYYKLYSYKSIDKTYSSGVNVYLGTLDISVFDEITGAAVTSWNVHIINEDASEIYDSTSNNNPTVIDVDSVPNGDNSRVLINKSGYRDSLFIMDLPVNTHNSLNAYICPNGYNNLYLFQVNDEVGSPIKDAKITIRRYMSTTNKYENVSIVLTDGSGQTDVYLVPNVLYSIKIEKTGYSTENSDFTPDPDYFGYYYPKTFVLNIEDGDITPPYAEPEDIEFEAYFNRVDVYEIRYNLTDERCNLVDYQVYTYVITVDHGTQTYAGYSSGTNTCGSTNAVCSSPFEFIGDIHFDPIGLLVDVKIIYHYNHSVFGHQTGTIFLRAYDDSFYDSDDITDVFDDIFGENPIGWINFLTLLFFILAMFYADQRDANIILIFIGGSFLFINVFLGFTSSLQTISGGVIPILFIAVGILGMWNSNRRKN